MKWYWFLLMLPLFGGCQVVDELVKQPDVIKPVAEAAVVAGEAIVATGNLAIGAVTVVVGTAMLALIKLLGKEQ